MAELVLWEAGREGGWVSSAGEGGRCPVQVSLLGVISAGDFVSQYSTWPTALGLLGLLHRTASGAFLEIIRSVGVGVRQSFL